MTLQEFVAAQTREVAAWIVRSVGRMPADRLVWHPLDNGRDVIDQLVECAYMNTIVAEALRERTAFRYEKSAHERFGADFSEPGTAMSVVSSSAASLAIAIEAFPSNRLSDEFETPFGIGKKTFAWMLDMPYWNMTYHLGQISYIQTLYGDREM